MLNTGDGTAVSFRGGSGACNWDMLSAPSRRHGRRPQHDLIIRCDVGIRTMTATEASRNFPELPDAVERGETVTIPIDRAALDADELAVAAVSIAEYWVGIELADTRAPAADRARALVAITSAVEVLDYTEATAACHARLIVDARRGWKPIRRLRPDHRCSRRADGPDHPDLRREGALR